MIFLFSIEAYMILLLPGSIFHRGNKAGCGKGPKVAKRLFSKILKMVVVVDCDGFDDDDDDGCQDIRHHSCEALHLGGSGGHDVACDDDDDDDDDDEDDGL